MLDIIRGMPYWEIIVYVNGIAGLYYLFEDRDRVDTISLGFFFMYGRLMFWLFLVGGALGWLSAILNGLAGGTV